MPDDDHPFPPPPKKGSRLAVILAILFVSFIAGSLIGFDMCAKSENSQKAQTGATLFYVCAAGLVITTLVALIRLLVFIFQKFDRRATERTKNISLK